MFIALGKNSNDMTERFPYFDFVLMFVQKLDFWTMINTDRDSLRYTYNGVRRVRQLALGCESN